MLSEFVQDPKISALLSLLLGAFVSYVLGLRRLTLERRYHANELKDERQRQQGLRYLNDLNKTYASFTVAVDELYICAKTGQCDANIVHDRVREGKLALAQIQQSAPRAIFAIAGKCWEIVVLIVNNDVRYPRDFLSNALFAYVADFNWLAREHLSGDPTVQLPAARSAVFRLNATLEEWLRAPYGKDYSSSFMDWVIALPAPDESDPQYQRLKQLLQPPAGEP